MFKLHLNKSNKGYTTLVWSFSLGQLRNNTIRDIM